MGQQPFGNELQNYADRLALLDHVLTETFAVGRTHLVKYAVLAEARHLFPPLLPNLDHHGVHPVDVELALDLARRQDMLREREEGDAAVGTHRSPPSGQITVYPSPGFDADAVARQANVSMAEFGRDVGALVRVFPPRRISDEERPGSFIPGRGLETLDPIRKCLRDDNAWTYASSRWLSPKLKPIFRGVAPLRVSETLTLPIPDVRLEPETARSMAWKRMERILKSKERVQRYVLRISEVDSERHDEAEMANSDVLYAVHVVNGPWDAGGGLTRCIVSESFLSTDSGYRLTLDLDEEGFRWKLQELRARKLLVCGRLGWDGRDFTILAYGAVAVGSLPSPQAHAEDGRQGTLAGYM